MSNEYNCPCTTGKPKVAFRETISKPVKYDFSFAFQIIYLLRFDYLHKKQTGGAGQYGRVIGTMTPIVGKGNHEMKFEDKMIGMGVPKIYVPAIEKGFLEACEEGKVCPFENIHHVLLFRLLNRTQSSGFKHYFRRWCFTYCRLK